MYHIVALLTINVLFVLLTQEQIGATPFLFIAVLELKGFLEIINPMPFFYRQKMKVGLVGCSA